MNAFIALFTARFGITGRKDAADLEKKNRRHAQKNNIMPAENGIDQSRYDSLVVSDHAWEQLLIMSQFPDQITAHLFSNTRKAGNRLLQFPEIFRPYCCHGSSSTLQL